MLFFALFAVLLLGVACSPLGSDDLALRQNGLPAVHFPLHRTGDRSSPRAVRKRDRNAPLSFLDQGDYYTPVNIGSQTFNLVIDTGSSDTWVPALDVQCQDQSSPPNPKPLSYCEFGAFYTPGKEFKRIEGEVFGTGYGCCQDVEGYFGITNVTVAGVSVKTQLGVAKHANWSGGNETSGYLGLAFPALTGAYNISNTTEQIIYDPVFSSMVKQGLVSPTFGMALNRPSKAASATSLDGYFSLGGIPPVKTVGQWATAPIQYIVNDSRGGYIPTILPHPQHEWWVVGADAFLYQPATCTTCTSSNKWLSFPYPSEDGSNLYNASQVQLQFDSGVDFIYMPPKIADALSTLFYPPAVRIPGTGGYSVACDAKAPGFALQIGGVVFPVDRRDLIFLDKTTGTCLSGVRNGEGYPPYSLGDSFLQNVVAVHDLAKLEMRIASRGTY